MSGSRSSCCRFLITLIPQLAEAVRRLHDANFSGWMILLRLLPWVGDIILVVLTVMPSDPGVARFRQTLSREEPGASQRRGALDGRRLPWEIRGREPF